MKEKLEMISNLFEGKEIRSIWDSEKEDYYFSVVDVIEALTNSNNPNDLATLKMWQEKAITSKNYMIAIEVWTKRDPLKI